MKSFADLVLSDPLARAIQELGFTKPTPIQAKALPILLDSPVDFIGQAATGTGKTAAFGIPLLEAIDPAKNHVQGIILCPTRELAMQVADQISLLGKYMNINVLPIYGGTAYGPQFSSLRRGAHIIVGTPGRIIDHIGRKSLSLKYSKLVILDEADEMISMGFKEELEKILQATPRDTSNIWLFSATMSRDVRRVADTYLKKPKQVHVNPTEMLPSTVEQIYYSVRESDKPEILCKLIDITDDFYGLVFCQTRALVTELTQYLAGRNYKVDCLHGDKSQNERESTMRAFREKKTRLLICTDVASRGLDVKDLTHVINYSIPRELQLYVHRIGRTARSGKKGIAISLVTPVARRLIARIEQMTKTPIKQGTVPGRREIAQKKISRILARFQDQKHYARAVDLLGPEWEKAVDNMSLSEIIGRFMTMLAPEVFSDQAKQKPLTQPHVPRTSDRPKRPRNHSDRRPPPRSARR